MNFKLLRNITIVSFILFLLMIFLLTGKIWNVFLDTKQTINSGVLIFYLAFIFILVTILFITSYFLSDENHFSQAVTDKVEQEKIKILKEFETKEEADETVNTTELTNGIVKNMIPKGQFKNIDSFAGKLLSNTAKELEIIIGLFYLKNKKSERYSCIANYAYTNEEYPPDFNSGENLNGQAAATQEILYVNNIPEEYFSAESGLGKSKPKYVTIVPIVYNDKTIAVMELGSFKEFNEQKKEVLTNLSNNINEKIIKIMES